MTLYSFEEIFEMFSLYWKKLALLRSDTILVSTINDADQGSADVAFRTPLAPYEKSKSLASGGIIAIVGLQRGILSKRESSAHVDYVPALCIHCPSLLPIEWSGEVFGLRRHGRFAARDVVRSPRTLSFRGRRSRNKVSVGEPVEGSLSMPREINWTGEPVCLYPLGPGGDVQRRPLSPESGRRRSCLARAGSFPDKAQTMALHEPRNSKLLSAARRTRRRRSAGVVVTRVI
ncbi:hypothetical protein Fmac_033003 [Flemingia macrophylla]|uniref:Uncharacterized protein n=1 Tax=Flemingia macrophylla TaxID=520843 RepID=A0ABD1L6H9_9FABA